MPSKHFIKFTCSALLLMLASAPTTQAALAQDDVMDTINQLRAGGCNARQKLPPLLKDARLQSAAARLATGATLQNAVDAVEYQAAQLSSIQLSGYDNQSDLRVLLHKKYCGLLLDGRWQQVGVAQPGRGGDRLWIVLAEPQRIPTDNNAIAAQVLQRVNAARATALRCGNELLVATTPLRANAVLNKAAQSHANDMAEHRHMDHAGSDGSTPAQRITRQGYRWRTVGENVAAGPGSAEEVVNGWLSSPGHCANMMSPAFTEMGVAFAVNRHDQYAVYWAQSFATPR